VFLLAAGNSLCLDSPVDVASYFFVALLAYLVGSIPTGYLLGRARGIDIRTVGSGNIGATNVFRELGKGAGVLALAADALKGFGAVRLIPLLFESAPSENLRIAAGISAILGHNYTCWLRFRGGKGIATSAGVLLAWMPVALAVVLGVWLLVCALSRYVSLASIAAAFFLPIAVWLAGGSIAMIMIGSIIGAMAIYKHRSNIRRLLNGTESRFRFRNPATSRQIT
jgi:acyl phosphate:glycerol-3-phosphate acyltransferase